MPSVIAILKVKEDKIEEAQAFFKELIADVTAKEPGTLAYIAHRRRDDPRTFLFYEKYENDAALAAHSKNLAAAGKRFMALLDGPPDIAVLEEI